MSELVALATAMATVLDFHVYRVSLETPKAYRGDSPIGGIGPSRC